MEVEEKAYFRSIGRGFVIHSTQKDGPVGRTLVRAYIDQNDIRYVEINGSIVPLSRRHDYLVLD